MTGNTIPGLSGVWKPIGQQRVLDDQAAIKQGYVDDAGHPAPHGTYTPIKHFVIWANADNSFIRIFDDNGSMCTCHWNNKDAWISDQNSIEFDDPKTETSYTFAPGYVKVKIKDIQPDPAGPPMGQASGVQPIEVKGGGQIQNPDLIIDDAHRILLTIDARLALDKYDVDNCPSGAKPGDRYIRSLGSGESLPKQTITYDALPDTFTWCSETDDEGLIFQRVDPQVTVTDPTAPKFGDTFLGQNQMAQIAFPFYGFDPRNLDLYPSGSHEEAGPGTPAITSYASNPNQTFNGTLVFSFPQADSRDYIRDVDLPHTPFLPIGLSGTPIGTEEDQTHTEMVSSIADRMRSLSVTLGFSAGAEKMFNVDLQSTVSSKIEEQQKNESRYTVSRKLGKSWVLFTELPSLKLHPDFLTEIQSLTVALIEGANPESMNNKWKNFVNRFGTHYLHAMTQGHMEYAETRFSLAAESTAYTNKIDIKAEASVVIEGAKGGAKGEYSNEWSNKTGLEVSEEDITTFSIGNDFPMGIFFDLRPLSELMSPIFIPYNPSDDWGQFAPWVWQPLRKSFSDYLNSIGLNQPITDPSFLVDYTPWKWTVDQFSVMKYNSPFTVEAIKLAPTEGNVFLDSGVLNSPPARISELSFNFPARVTAKDPLQFKMTPSIKTEDPVVINEDRIVNLDLGSDQVNGCESFISGDVKNKIDINFVARRVEPLFKS